MFTRDLAPPLPLGRATSGRRVYVNRWFSPGVLEAPVEGLKPSGFGAAGAAKYQHTNTLIFSA